YRGKINTEAHKLEELAHQKKQLLADMQKIRFDFESSNLKDLSDRQKSATELTGKVRELTFKHNKQTLLAPVDGYVDTIFVHTIGGVVSPAEKLMTITPANTPMLVEASVPNKDIGFIKDGMPA